MRNLILFVCFAILTRFASADGRPVVIRAFADREGRVHIAGALGARETVIPPEKGQQGIDNIRVAADGRTVGWLVKSAAGCCVSYPVPLELVLWRDGHMIRRVHPPQAIFGWTFLKDGTEVAYHQAPLHGPETYLCEKLDVKTGKLLERWDRNSSKRDRPEWVQLLAEQAPVPDSPGMP